MLPVCLCGATAGTHHRFHCPYPIFNPSQRGEEAWLLASRIRCQALERVGRTAAVKSERQDAS
jgi:hypothetical protein